MTPVHTVLLTWSISEKCLCSFVFSYFHKLSLILLASMAGSDFTLNLLICCDNAMLQDRYLHFFSPLGKFADQAFAFLNFQLHLSHCESHLFFCVRRPIDTPLSPSWLTDLDEIWYDRRSQGVASRKNFGELWPTFSGSTNFFIVLRAHKGATIYHQVFQFVFLTSAKLYYLRTNFFAIFY